MAGDEAPRPSRISVSSPEPGSGLKAASIRTGAMRLSRRLGQRSERRWAHHPYRTESEQNLNGVRSLNVIVVGALHPLRPVLPFLNHRVGCADAAKRHSAMALDRPCTERCWHFNHRVQRLSFSTSLFFLIFLLFNSPFLAQIRCSLLISSSDRSLSLFSNTIFVQFFLRSFSITSGRRQSGGGPQDARQASAHGSARRPCTC